MGIFDALTGAPASNAANAQRGLFDATRSNIQSLADLTRGVNQGFISKGYDDARGNLASGYGAATGAINQGAGSALGYLDDGTSGALGRIDAARGGIGGAYQPLNALAGRFGAGSGLYADALGINGPEGTTRAQSAFTAGPGYDWQVDQGLDAINRSRNARGGLNSGNTDIDALKFGQGLAKQEYGSWLDRLSPYNQLELAATSGAATGTAAENAARGGYDLAAAGLLDASGRNRANVATGQGNSLADIHRAYFGGQAGLDTAESGALTNNMDRNSALIAQSQLQLAPQTAKTYGDEAAAQMAASGNALNLGMNIAKLAAGAAGGFPSLGGGFPASADAFRMGFADPLRRA